LAYNEIFFKFSAIPANISFAIEKSGSLFLVTCYNEKLSLLKSQGRMRKWFISRPYKNIFIIKQKTIDFIKQLR